MGIFDKSLNDSEKLECLELDIKFKNRRIKELENELIETKSKLSYSKGLLKQLRSKSMNNPTLRECILYLHDEGIIGEVDFVDLINELDELYEIEYKYYEEEEEDEDS